MASVKFETAVGGDGSTVSDDGNALTGLANGGHRLRFVPALKQIVAIAQYIVGRATAAASSATAAAGSAINSANSATAAVNSQSSAAASATNAANSATAAENSETSAAASAANASASATTAANTAVANHTAAADPHTQYLNVTRGDARYPLKAGTGATGTWGINITGSATGVPWTGVTGRPTAVSAFANDSGYINQTAANTAASYAVGAHASAADPHAQYVLEAALAGSVSGDFTNQPIPGGLIFKSGAFAVNVGQNNGANFGAISFNSPFPNGCALVIAGMERDISAVGAYLWAPHVGRARAWTATGFQAYCECPNTGTAAFAGKYWYIAIGW